LQKSSQVVEVEKGVRLLRFAVVFGANASGKSNLLSAFDFLQSFLFEKHSNLDEPIEVIPFMLDAETPNQPSRFELVFYVGSVKYWYQLELDSKQVYAEKLSVYRSIQPTMLFIRELKDNLSVINF
jgi:AAA15 family ATPase/GTPase